MMFLSHEIEGVQCTDYSDRAFMVRSDDGGQSWQLLGDMTSDSPRSVMPNTVMLKDGTLVTSLRRRTDVKNVPTCWIEICQSKDCGITWEFVSKAGYTHEKSTDNNGNPPAMTLMDDGRLVLAYGYRGDKPVIKAKTSDDNGKTWSGDIILRDDAKMYDIGYPRMVTLSEGRVVTIYYFSSNDMQEQHIEATVWKP